MKIVSIWAFIRSSFIVLLLIGVSACTTLKPSDDPSAQVSNDPLVGVNRSIYNFNTAADKAILKPAATAYHAVLPDPVENSVSRFFSNLSEPLSALNNLLQGDVNGALESTYRFTVNSTVGVLGLFDVAKHYGVKQKREDFGQTLAAWGVKPGPYIMLPLLGPTNLRDGVGRVVSTSVFYPNNEISESANTRLGLFVLDGLSTRASLLGTDNILENQLDPYLFLKSAFEKSRTNSVYDGNPPVEEDDDLDF